MKARRLTFDKTAIPGIVCTVVGGIVCALWLGWDYGLAFVIGATFGSIRRDR